MPDLVSDVTALARSLLDDAGGDVFTDPVLIPFVASAYRKLQGYLSENNVRTVEERSPDINLVAVTQTTISDSTSPALPTDLIVPYELEEKPTGSGEMFKPMTKLLTRIPDVPQKQNLYVWSWYSDRINLLGASVATTVRVVYEKGLPDLAVAADPILIRGSIDALAYGAAALAARSRGATQMAADCEAQFADEAHYIVSDQLKGDLYVGTRRRPYRCR